MPTDEFHPWGLRPQGFILSQNLSAKRSATMPCCESGRSMKPTGDTETSRTKPSENPFAAPIAKSYHELSDCEGWLIFMVGIIWGSFLNTLLSPVVIHLFQKLLNH